MQTIPNSIHCCRYIPAGSDLELECQVDLGEHGPDDHYRQSHIYEKSVLLFQDPENGSLELLAFYPGY